MSWNLDLITKDKGPTLGVILSFKLVGWLWILSSESICPAPTIHISPPLQSSLSCQIKGYLHLWILLYITYWILHRITWYKTELIIPIAYSILGTKVDLLFFLFKSQMRMLRVLRLRGPRLGTITGQWGVPPDLWFSSK